MNEARIRTEEIIGLDLGHPYDPTIDPTDFIKNKPIKDLIKFHQKIWFDKCSTKKRIKPAFIDDIYF